MKCAWCDEPILATDKVTNGTCDKLHSECAIRLSMGPASHQLRQCPCFGGTIVPHPGLTKRRSAVLAAAVWLARGMPPPEIPGKK